MKVKVTHKECFARQTVRMFKKVGKLIKKQTNTESENLFFLLGGGR